MTPQENPETARANAAREVCTCGLFRANVYACLDCWETWDQWRPTTPEAP